MDRKRGRKARLKHNRAPAAPTEPQALSVPVYGGRHTARVTREADPEGKTVARVRITDQWPIDRLHSRGRLTYRQWDAGDRFRRVFARAVLQGRFATLDLYRFDKSHSEGESDHVAVARQEVRQLLEKGGKTSGVALWFVVGCGDTLEDVALRMKRSRIMVNRHHVMGLVVAGLDILADHYKLTK